MRKEILVIAALAFGSGAAHAGYGVLANGKVLTNLAAGTQTSDAQGGASLSVASIDVLADEVFNLGGGISGHGTSRLRVTTEVGRIHAMGEGFATSTRIVGYDGGYTRFAAKDDFTGASVGSWYDVIHVTHPTLPTGSPVKYRATATLEGTKSAFAPFPNNGTHVYLRMGAAQYSALVVMQDGVFSASRDVVIDTFVGDVFTLGSSLEVQGETSLTNGGPSTCRVDAWNTGLVTLDSLTPGASFVSDSGYRYAASPVPEPGAMAALGLGVAALVGRRRRV